LKTLGEQKQAGQILAGFALETNDEEKNAVEKLQKKNLDFIILNSLNDAAGKVEELGMNTHIKTEDLYNSIHADEVLSIKTYYEKKYLTHNKNINYLKFSFK